MKRILFGLVVLGSVLGFTVLAGPRTYVVEHYDASAGWTASGQYAHVWTGATASVNTYSTYESAGIAGYLNQPIKGYVNRVTFDIGGTAASNIDIDVREKASFDGTAYYTTILSIDDVAADATYYPRVRMQSTAGAQFNGATSSVEKVAIDGFLEFLAADSNNTGVTAKVIVYLDDVP